MQMKYQSKFAFLTSLVAVSCNLNTQFGILGESHMNIKAFNQLTLKETFPNTQNKDFVFIFDVDGTIYSDELDVERKIIENTYEFVTKFIPSISNDRVEKLHQEYGSVIEGIIQEELMNGTRLHVYNHYKEFVFRNIVMLISENHMRSGYNLRVLQISNLLKHIPTKIIFASNSPKFHVKRVLSFLNISVDDNDIFTPDENGFSITDARFWKPILEKYPLDSFNLFLFDDNQKNVKFSSSLGIQGIEISKENSLTIVLLRMLKAYNNDFKFNEISYLDTKNSIDITSLNSTVLNQLKEKLNTRLQTTSVLNIIDLGAGRLNMLETIIKILNPSLLETKTTINYIAFEANKSVMKSCKNLLKDRGFVEMNDDHFFKELDSIIINIRLSDLDFLSERAGVYIKNVFSDVDLIIGCCVADLIEPSRFVDSVMKFSRNALVYLPITFCGSTKIHCNCSFINEHQEAFFASYHESLKLNGHHFVSSELINEFKNYHYSVVSQGGSNWTIDKNLNEYMWYAMLHFFATSVSLEDETSLTFLRSLNNFNDSLELQVENKDTLFESNKIIRKELIFQSCRNISIKEEIIDSNSLRDNDVLIHGEFSLISSGTELKVFRGDFDENSDLDLTIDGMKNKVGFPLGYGYSHVGKIINMGKNVSFDMIGRRVFSFSPHASHVIANVNSVITIPDEVSLMDATFFPSLETAVSLVMCAHPLIGEVICVVGQGIIGLLTTLVLQLYYLNNIIVIDVNNKRLDIARKLFTNCIIHNPTSGNINISEIDTSIEVSGNIAGLQTAIDITSEDGKIILGSLYGEKQLPLRLGMKFHRSNLKLLTSQVSLVPKDLCRWTKTRRFNLCWKLLKELKPSKICRITSALGESPIIQFNESIVQSTYESLEKGELTLAILKYN